MQKKTRELLSFQLNELFEKQNLPFKPEAEFLRDCVGRGVMRESISASLNGEGFGAGEWRFWQGLISGSADTAYFH